MHIDIFTLSETPLTETFIQKTCLNCGTVFDVSTRPRRGPKQKYCQHSCATNYHCKHVRDKAVQRNWIASYFTDNPAKRFLASTKQNAKQRGLAFDLTEEWFKQRLDRGICEVTGLPIKIKLYKAQDVGNRGFYSPSIDRIDNAIGYVPSNCRLVCWGYNMAKNKFTDRDLNALAVSLLLQSVPEMAKANLMALIPNTLLAALPSGHGMF